VIKRIVVSNFRSLGEDVVVELGPLTALVGVNGSGKSNVADVLQFVADCLNRGLDVAMSRRGGISALRRAGAGEKAAIRVRVEVEDDFWWEFSIGESAPDDYCVLSERVALRGLVSKEPEPELELPSYFPSLLSSTSPIPFAGLLHEELQQIAIYKIFPNRLRQPQTLDLRKPMREHGENWASILRGLEKNSRGCDLLAALGQIVGDIDDYRTTAVGGFVIPEFRHITESGSATWLGASQESDGTLRMAGILTALLQEPPLTLVGIEEPELAVHPGAIGVLFDHFREASTRGQVLLTTHSSELLDLLDIDEIRVVERRDNVTTVSRVEEAQRALVKRRLATTSELIWSEGLRGATGTDGRR
jgi:predicted ATPase